MNIISNALKGAAMGIAEIIPGVSGGTIAFITGIYERLLNCIKAFNFSLIKTFKESGVKGVWEAIDGMFLLTLIMGMGFGVIVGVFGVTHLLENYPEPLWAFFFGLIIASAVYIGKQIPSWRASEFVLIAIGVIVAYGITILPVGEGSKSLLYVFLAGTIAISALILPGISGSFMLLLMGMYTYIIPSIKLALKEQDPEALMVLIVFAGGCLVGLLTFARVLSWTFKNYHSPTLALLTGFMIGSLNKIWPWRIPLEQIQAADGELKTVTESNLMPNAYDAIAGNESHLVLCIVTAIIGFAVVFLLERLDNSQPEEA
ncbi:MAG: DUF368 domain-containing protein [Aureispira sp.]|nr:DUF368 domain-containing protein [Aureispira sp.]